MRTRLTQYLGILFGGTLLLGIVLIAFVQAQAPTTAPNEEWLTYTHPEWGITFQYPPGWEVSVPDFENIEQTPEDWHGLAPYEPNPDHLRTLGHHISLYRPAVSGFEVTEIAITLDVYTLSPNGTLEELVNLRGDLEDTTAPELASVREKVEVVDQEQPADVDDLLYTSVKSIMHESYITWMARGPLVYFVASFSSDPAVTSIGREIAASLQFNADKEQVLLETAPFNGDETTISNLIERLRSVHEEVGSELISYQGEGPYQGLGAPFELLYDPAVWELINEPESHNNRLSNLREPECIFRLQYGAVGSTTVGRVILADHEWFINQIQAKFISYIFPIDTYAYIFAVELPEDYRDGTKSSCQLMAEEVIDTFSVDMAR